jgi:hypothetical protein
MDMGFPSNVIDGNQSPGNPLKAQFRAVFIIGRLR